MNKKKIFLLFDFRMMNRTGITFLVAISVIAAILGASIDTNPSNAAGSQPINSKDNNNTSRNDIHDVSSFASDGEDDELTAEETRRKYYSRPYSPNYQLYSSMINTAARPSSYPYQYQHPNPNDAFRRPAGYPLNWYWPDRPEANPIYNYYINSLRSIFPNHPIGLSAPASLYGSTFYNSGWTLCYGGCDDD